MRAAAAFALVASVAGTGALTGALTACQPPATCPRAGSMGACEAACPAGARIESSKGPAASCACVDGVVLEGSCVTPATAAAFCGKAAGYQQGGCVPKPCPNGALDDVTGTCESPSDLREIGHAEDGENLGCDDGTVLLVDPSHVRCVDEKASCPRGAAWTNGGCQPGPACPPGNLPGGLPDRGPCVPFLRTGTGSGTSGGATVIVDVGTWARLALGPDGGEGTAALCSGVARRPWLFSALTGASPIRVRAEVTLTFPDNDVTRVHERVALWDLEHHALSEAATGALAQSARALVETLRSVGGLSSAASVTATVACSLLETSEPKGVPLADTDAQGSKRARAVPP
jgi:hypothetical protein